MKTLLTILIISSLCLVPVESQSCDPGFTACVNAAFRNYNHCVNRGGEELQCYYQLLDDLDSCRRIYC